MNSELLGLFMDFVILICLGATIYYTIKLSKNLNGFQQYRQDLSILINELSINIGSAQKAIENLKAASDDSGDNLRNIIKESDFLADELKLINETSDNLASRLEQLAEKSRIVSQKPKSPGKYDDFDNNYANEINELDKSDKIVRSLSTAHTKNGSSSPPSFFIQDREYSDLQSDQDNENGSSAAGGGGTDKFSSRAEKELYEALQKSQK